MLGSGNRPLLHNLILPQQDEGGEIKAIALGLGSGGSKHDTDCCIKHGLP